MLGRRRTEAAALVSRSTPLYVGIRLILAKVSSQGAILSERLDVSPN
jgi:hypothetical protein